MKQVHILLAIGLLFLIGCNSEAEQPLDIQLLEKLSAAGGSEELDHFILPSSDDYNNIPQDPLNPITTVKVELGKLLFHETALANNGNFTETVNTYSCASCHHAQGGFQANLPQGIGDGGAGFGGNGEGRIFNPFCDKDEIDVQPIRTPTVLNTAYQTNMLWNGQFGATGLNVGTEDLWPTDDTPVSVNHLGFEGLEVQGIAGLGVHRFGFSIEEDFIMNTEYKELFDVAFFEVPAEDRYSKVNAGLAIAAYERTVLSSQAPFQNWLRGDFSAMTEDQKEGALLFIDNNCMDCHTGPGLSSMSFHAFGFDDLFSGSYGGSEVINVNPEDGAHKGRGGFTKQDADNYKFKVPQLYNLRDSKFYGHGSSFTDLEELIRYKTKGVAQNSKVPSTQLSASFIDMQLTDDEILKLTDFIENALYDPFLERYVPSAVPSGNCFPNNDALSRIELDCL